MPNRERETDEKPSGSGVVSAGTTDVTAPKPGVSTTLLRAVLDTSALVPARMRRELQIAAQAGLYVGYWSPWIIAELNRVLTGTGFSGRHLPISRAPTNSAVALRRIP